MSDAVSKSTSESDQISVSAGASYAAILQDADYLLDLMGRESLDVVAVLANALRVSASCVGASEIESAANDIRRVVASGSPVVLASAMRSLTEALARARQKFAA